MRNRKEYGASAAEAQGSSGPRGGARSLSSSGSSVRAALGGARRFFSAAEFQLKQTLGKKKKKKTRFCGLLPGQRNSVASLSRTLRNADRCRVTDPSLLPGRPSTAARSRSMCDPRSGDRTQHPPLLPGSPPPLCEGSGAAWQGLH